MIPKLILQREETSDDGTFGRILDEDGRFLWWSGELPWRDNEPMYSCIPPGEYKCRFTVSPAFSKRKGFEVKLYLLSPTAPRTGIRIHAASFMGDAKKGKLCQLNGCVAPGEALAYVKGQKAIIRPGSAMNSLMNMMQGNPFDLHLRQ